MSCEKKDEWSKIPNVNTPCVQEIANFAVNQHYKESGECLKLKSVFEGWFLELSENKIKHRLYLVAANNKGVEQKYEAVVLVEEKSGHQRVRILISFDGGRLDDNGEFWIEIPDVNQSCVQDVSKFAVEKFNEDSGENLIYISTLHGWYREVNVEYGVLFDIRLQTKDCFGRVREYKALVYVDKPVNSKIRELKSFKLVPKKC